MAACGRGPDPGAPAPPGSQLPGLSLRSDGAPVLSWIEPASDGHRLAYSVQDVDGWTKPVTVAEGADWFVNWADVPSVVPLTDELWAAHWLVKQPGGMYAYDIALSLSQDGGHTWTPPVRPHDDTTPTEHGFVSLWPAILANGEPGVGLVWLDGRAMLLDASASATQDPRTMLRYGIFNTLGHRVAAGVVDDRVCDCCPTAVATTGTGPVVAYRDRQRGEVRDIRVARWADGRWLELGTAGTDGWVIEGCPVNGPAIAARDDAIAVAWYTEAGGERRVRAARFVGTGWTEPVTVAAGYPLGRVGIVWLDDADAAVTWLHDLGEGQAELRIARVGTRSVAEPLTIARTESTRPAGMPRLLRAGSELTLAWTRWTDGTSRVVTATVPVAQMAAAAAGTASSAEP